MDNFTEINYTRANLDRYIIRVSILKSIKKKIHLFKKNFLDVGCGKMPYKKYILENSKVEKYIGLDIENALIYDNDIKPDYFWDGKKMPFKNNSFETTFATEVLEHCPEPNLFLNEIYRVLEVNGVFFFTVPFLWNLHEVPHDEYRYTPFSLRRLLKQSGFVNIDIQATGGWHASMAQMLGLWVRRAPLCKKTQSVLSILLKPIIKYLYKKDIKQDVKFSEGVMITGLYGTAEKK